MNVGVNNPGIAVYIKGNETTDGSIRFLIDSSDGMAVVRERTNGVWNDTSLRVASASISLGRDLKVSAIGGFIETRNQSEMTGHLRAAIPHIQFAEQGTINSAHMPIFDKREDFVIFAGPNTGEKTGTTIGQVFSATPTRVLHSSTHIVGSIAATAPIQVSYYKGADNTGDLLNRFNIPASTMGTANTSFTITYEDDFGFENAQNIFFEYVSANSISMQTNASGNVITTQNGHTFDELDIILDEFVLSDDLSLLFTNDLGFVVHERF